eukprot:TRINITY_DN9818_c0_g1_i4.p1 TRINITY_DN9818_c0_g1~~TRINITY_DN9818_c0_g1_i4.p1  ORF type:complete len:259 (+),score=48.94 TRINITY_DN9818_c0_g1_i4:127-903(+)
MCIRDRSSTEGFQSSQDRQVQDLERHRGGGMQPVDGRGVIDRVTAAKWVCKLCTGNDAEQQRVEAAAMGMIPVLCALCVSCDCGKCAASIKQHRVWPHTPHLVSTNEEREAAAWALYQIGLVRASVPELIERGAIRAAMLLLHLNQRVQEPAAAMLSTLAACPSSMLPEGFGWQWRVDSIAPLVRVLKGSPVKASREWAARALELQAINGKDRTEAERRGVKFYDIEGLVAAELGVAQDRVKMRAALARCVKGAVRYG